MHSTRSQRRVPSLPAALPLRGFHRDDAAKFRGGGLILLAIVGMAVVSWATPLAGEAWEFNRPAVANGEWSRLLTGHLVHWNFNHLLWNGALFLVLGVACVWRSVGRTVATLLAAAAAISGTIYLLQPGVETYRGLTGLDAALFTLLAGGVWRESRRTGARGLSIAAGLAGAAFLAKAAFDVTTGTTLTTDSPAAGFPSLALAHLVGGVVGAVVALLPASHSTAAAPNA